MVSGVERLWGEIMRKKEFILRTDISASEKRMVMAWVNAMLKHYKNSNPPVKISFEHIRQEFFEIAPKDIFVAVTHSLFSRAFAQAQKKGTFENQNEEFIEGKSWQFVMADNMTECFTREDYEACKIAIVEKSPEPTQKTEIIKNPDAPKRKFWEASPEAKKDEDKKADIYLMAINILERLQPMLLNVIYEELNKEVANAP